MAFNKLLRLAIKSKVTAVSVSVDPTETPENLAIVLDWYGKRRINQAGSEIIYPADLIKLGDEPDPDRSPVQVCIDRPDLTHVGQLSPPNFMILWYIGAYTTKPEKYFELLSGLSLQRIGDVLTMASAMSGKISLRNVAYLTSQLRPVEGLEILPPVKPYYHPTKKLAELVAAMSAARLSKLPVELQVSGVLFKGAPGTGKTQAAAYMAEALALPAYRVELSQVLSKYHGESDRRLGALLDTASKMAPAVVLLDEIEKLFKSENSDDIIRRLLAQLLWWLQTKPESLIVVMTSNDPKAVPAELLRPERIDESLELLYSLQELNATAADYLRYLSETYELDDGVKFKKLNSSSKVKTPAQVVATIRKLFRD